MAWRVAVAVVEVVEEGGAVAEGELEGCGS